MSALYIIFPCTRHKSLYLVFGTSYFVIAVTFYGELRSVVWPLYYFLNFLIILTATRVAIYSLLLRAAPFTRAPWLVHGNARFSLVFPLVPYM